MSFSLEPHPEIPEGINLSKTHPLVEFGYLVLAVVGSVLAVILVAQLLAGYLVRFISFEMESDLFLALAPESLYQSTEELDSGKSAYLQSLADRLAAEMELPSGMTVAVHYDDSDTPNAYATLGGNIVIYQGLIDQLSSENGLAMVVAHEIAHIKHRDPIMSLGRGLVSVIALSLMSGVADSGMVGSIVNITGTSLLSKFSRDQESDADQVAIEAVIGVYGSLEGADEFFITMSEGESELGMEFFSTHPATDNRIRRIEAAGQPSGNSVGMLTPLPPVLLNEDQQSP